MFFLSYEFLLIFLPVTALLYHLGRRFGLRNIVLAVASIVFYACYGIPGLACLVFSIAVTYISGRCGHRLVSSGNHRGKAIYAAGIVLNLLPLLVLKYTAFAVESVNGFFGAAIPVPEFLLPVGLSFFIFQSSTYLFELWQGKVEPEHNVIRYALFVAFFPTITSGPIQRSHRLLAQIREERRTSFERIQQYAILFMWGAFLKMVLADRLAIFTTAVFGEYTKYDGWVLLTGAVAYSVQIYADFLGYSCMAIAVAGWFGFELADNFRQPYLATGIADFWRRWHISLTSWLTDFVYIPLGGSRKGQVRRYVNILIVFLVSGLWHGANWTFLAWGAIHAVYQIVGRLTLGLRQKLCKGLAIDRESRAYRYWQRAFIFAIVTLAWIFFRSPDLSSSVDYIRRMFSVWNPWVLGDGTLLKLGLSGVEWVICVAAAAALVCVSVHRENKPSSGGEGTMISRAMLFTVLLLLVVVFGIYGGEYSASAFIYAGF